MSISFDCLRRSFSSSSLLPDAASEISPLFLVWMTSTAPCSSGQIRSQIGADLVAVAGVVDHDEQDGLLAELLVLGVALPPFLDAELQIVGVALGDDRTLLLGELGAAGGVGQDRMLDDVLSDRLDERVVAHGLDEDRAVVVARRRGDVDLNREAAVLLQQLVMDVLNAT